MKIKLSLGGALLLLVVLFAVQNSAVVTIQFLPWKFTASLGLVLFFTGGAGTLIGWLLGTAIRLLAQNNLRLRLLWTATVLGVELPSC